MASANTDTDSAMDLDQVKPSFQQLWILLLVLLLSQVYLCSGYDARDSDIPGQCSAVCDCHRMAEELSVHCSHSGLRTVPDFGSSSANITNLELSDNDFNTLDRHTFPSLPRLVRLDMLDSGIIMIGNKAFINLPNLEHLELERNQVQYLNAGMFDGCPALRSLSLGYNSVRTVGSRTFSGLHLDHLNLQNNQDLGYIALDAFEDTTLSLLNVDGCDLDSSSLFSLRPLHGSVRTLYLSRNKKPLVIPPSLLWNFTLEILHVTNDGLRDLSFLDVAVTVEQLDISDNPLVSMDIGAWPGLLYTRVLIMNSCQLLTLNNTSNREMQHLEELHLSNNRLTELNPRVFLRLSGLRRLDLRENLIRTITEMHLPVFDQLDNVDLQGNPLSCDCRMEWLRLFLHSRRSSGFLDSATCLTPTRITLSSWPSPFKCIEPSDVNIQLSAKHNLTDGVTSVYITCSARGYPPPDLTISQDVHYESTQMVTLECPGGSSSSSSSKADWQTSYICASANLSRQDCVVFYCGAINFLGTLHGHVSTCESQITRSTNMNVSDDSIHSTISTVLTTSTNTSQSHHGLALTAVTCVVAGTLLCGMVFVLTSCTRTGHVVRPTCLTPDNCSRQTHISLVEEEMVDNLSTTRLIVEGDEEEGQQKDVL